MAKATRGVVLAGKERPLNLRDKSFANVGCGIASVGVWSDGAVAFLALAFARWRRMIIVRL